VRADIRSVVTDTSAAAAVAAEDAVAVLCCGSEADPACPLGLDTASGPAAADAEEDGSAMRRNRLLQSGMGMAVPKRLSAQNEQISR